MGFEMIVSWHNGERKVYKVYLEDTTKCGEGFRYWCEDKKGAVVIKDYRVLGSLIAEIAEEDFFPITIEKV